MKSELDNIVQTYIDNKAYCRKIGKLYRWGRSWSGELSCHKFTYKFTKQRYSFPIFVRVTIIRSMQKIFSPDPQIDQLNKEEENTDKNHTVSISESRGA